MEQAFGPFSLHYAVGSAGVEQGFRSFHSTMLLGVSGWSRPLGHCDPEMQHRPPGWSRPSGLRQRAATISTALAAEELSWEYPIAVPPASPLTSSLEMS